MPRLMKHTAIVALFLLTTAMSAQAQPVLTLLGFDPPDEGATNRGSAVIRYDVTNGTNNRVDVTFFRGDGASTLVAGLQPGTGPFSVTVPLPRGVDGQTVTFTGIAQDSVTGQLAAGDRQLTIVADDTAPAPPNIISPAFPATVNSDILTVQGTVARAGGTPETSGTVTIIKIDDPGAGSIIGAGAIRADGAFTATADLSSCTTGVACNIGFRAEDSAGNRSTQIDRVVTKAQVEAPAINNATIEPAPNTITNNPAVLVRGSVNGTNGPFTVNFIVDGFLESQITGLGNGDNFSHTLTLSTDGVHNISIRAENSNAPPESGTLVNLGQINLDRVDPAAPVIIEPNPVGPTPVVTSAGLTIRGFSGERSPSNTSTQLPVVLVSGPPGVSFAPGSPLTIDPQTGQFETRANVASLQDGEHRLTFAVRDAAGNSGPGSSVEVIFVRDTRPPVVDQIRVDGTIAPQTNPEIFVGQTSVNIQFRTNEELTNVPSLQVTQSRGSALRAGVSSNTAQVFNYVYGTIPGFDGPVQLTLSGGRDRAGNALNTSIPRVFIADTTPPNVTSVSPTDASSISASPDRIRISLQDPPSASGTASGLDLIRTRLTLEGPLGSASQTIAGTQTPFDPFTIDFVPSSPLTADGTYRIRVVAVDKVNNRTENFSSTFIFDATGIVPSESNVISTPADGTCVNAQSIPGGSAAPFVEVRLTDEQVDLASTTVVVRDFCRVPPEVPGTTQIVQPDIIRFIFSQPLATDGTRDGVYNIAVTMRDQAGNFSPEFNRNFTYDTLAPSVQSTFPSTDSAVTGPLRSVDALLADPRFDNCRIPCGIDRTATSTEFALLLVTPNPSTSRRRNAQLPFLIPGTLRFISEGNFDKVLLEIVGPDLATSGLLTDGQDDGIYRLEVTAVDGAGNRSALTSSTFVFDNIQPDLRLDNIENGIFLTGNEFTITGSSLDNPSGSGVDRVTFSLQSVDVDGNPTTSVPIFINQNAVLDPATPGVENERRKFTFTGDIRAVAEPTLANLTIRSIDRSGNVKEAIFRVNLQTSALRPPEISGPPTRTATSNPIVTFSWIAVPGAANYQLRIIGPNADEVLRFSDNETEISVNLAPLTMGDGTYLWAVSSIDPLGRQGFFSQNRRLILDRERPRVVAVDIIDPSPEAVGTVNEGEVRFTIRFSEPMDTRFALSPRIRPQNTAAPFIDLVQTTFDGDTWTGRAIIDETGPNGTDFNGLAELEILGVRNGLGVETQPRDLAGNRPEPPPLSLLVFEIDTGPFFQVSLFQNPVDRKDVILVVKGFVRDGGPAERIDESLTVVVKRTSFTDQTPEMRRISESTFRGTFRAETDSIQPIRLAITGRDQQGNSITRNLTLSVTRLSPGGSDVIIGIDGVAKMKTQPEAVSETALIMQATEGEFLLESRPGEGPDPAASGLVAAGQFAQFYPSGMTFARQAELRVDLTRIVPPVSPALKDRIGLYESTGDGWRAIRARKEGDVLVAAVGSTGPYGLFADIQGPEISDLNPAEGERAETDMPEITARVSDGGSGVEGTSLSLKIDGMAQETRFDETSGQMIWKAERPMREGFHDLAIEASDRAGNKSYRVSRLVAPPAFGFAEMAAYPNPARMTSSIRYRLNQTADSVKIRIHDVSGRRIRTLDGPVTAGLHTVPWLLMTDGGDTVANGVYLVRITARQGKRRSIERLKIAVLR